MKLTDRPSRPWTDPFTARAGAVVLCAIASGMLFVSSHALGTGCIGLMRGRHGPSVAHCAPEPAYWAATLVLIVFGFVVALASGYLWRYASRQASA